MLVIGISGGTGSGKTTVVENIVSNISLDRLNILSQDNYYKDNQHLSYEQRVSLNYDHPLSIDFDLLIDNIKKLKEGKSVEEPIYSFSTHLRTKEKRSITPKDILIVEGILVLENKKLRDEFDIKVFVYADSDERLIRRIKRDINERGRDLNEVLNRYQTTIKPMHEEFIQPSMNYADIIIPTMKYNDVAIDLLSNIIKNA